MAANKIESYMGFAIRKGSALFGVDNVIESRKKPKLILFDVKLSERSQNRLRRYAETNGIASNEYPLSDALPGKNCLALGVTDESLAKAIISVIKEI